MGDVSRERFMTGNHVRLYMSGDGARVLLGEGTIGPVSKLTSQAISRRTGATEIHVCGDPEPQETVDGRHSYSVQLSMLKLRAEVPGAADMVNAGPVDIEVLDRFMSKVLAVAEGCKLTDGSDTIPANAPVTRNLSFIALRIRNS
jgi:hypothetical protein